MFNFLRSVLWIGIPCFFWTVCVSATHGQTAESQELHSDLLRLTGTVLVAAVEPEAETRVTLRRAADNYTSLRSRLLDESPAPVVSEVVADRSGRFEISVPETGVYELEVRRSGFVPARYRPISVTQDLEAPPLRLRPDVGLRVQLSAPGVSALRLEAVPATRPAGRRSRLWEPSPRRVFLKNLAAGSQELSLPRAENEALELRLGFEAAPPLIRHADRVTAWTIDRPNPSPSRTLKIIDSAGEAVANAVVLTGEKLWPTALSNSQGVVKLTETVDGLQVLTPSGALLTGKVDDHRIRVREATSLQGRVTTRSGRGLPNALVWSALDPGAFTHTDLHGRFVLPNRDVGGRLFVEASGFATITGEIPQQGPMDIVLEKSASLVGCVEDTHGRPIAGVEIALFPVFGARRTPAAVGPIFVFSDPMGHFKVTGMVPTAAYDLIPRHSDYLPNRLNLATPSVGEDRKIQVQMSRRRSGFGWVTDLQEKPLREVEIRLEPKGEQRGLEVAVQATTDAEGRFEIPAIPAERVDLIAERAGFAPIRVRGISIQSEDQPSTPFDFGVLLLEPASSIQGVVTNIDDRPIAGASVWMIESPAHAAWTYLEQIDQSPAKVETDQQGRFELKDLQRNRPFHILVDHPEFRAHALDSIEAPIQGPLKIRLEQGIEVSGQVVDEEGNPVANALVELAPGGSLIGAEEIPLITSEPARKSNTDSKGLFRFAAVPAGQLELQAFYPDLLPSKRIEIRTETEESIKDLRLTLATGAVLVGTIQLPDGSPVAAARVSVTGSHGVAFSSQDGSYEIRGVPEGEATVVVSHDVYRRLESPVLLDRGINTQDFLLQPGQTIIGEVVDPEGHPVPDARARLISEEPFERHRFLAATNFEGFFELPQVAFGAYTVTIDKKGYSSVVQTLEVRPSESVSPRPRLVLHPALAVEGHATGLSFEDIEQLEIQAVRDGYPPQRAEIDYDGRFRIASLHPGIWRLEGATRDQKHQVQRDVLLREAKGTTEQDLDFATGVRLRGRISRAGKSLSGAHVSLTGRDHSIHLAARTDFDGKFELLSVEVGRYLLAFSHPRQLVQQSRQLEITADLDLEIEVETAKIVGHVVAATNGQPLEDARINLSEHVGNESGSFFSSPTNSDGFFAFPRVPTGRFTLVVTKAGYGVERREIEVNPGMEVAPLKFELEATPGLRLRPRLSTGAVPDHLVAAISTLDGRLLTTLVRPVTREGTVHFPNIPSGSWRLLLQAPGSASLEIEQQVPNEVTDATLAGAGQVRILVSEMLGSNTLAYAEILSQNGQPLRRVSLAEGLQTRSPLPGGHGVIEGVPAGSWLLKVFGPDGKEWHRVFQAPGQSETKIVLD